MGQIDYYKRHLLLPEVGIQGQRKLNNAKVLVVGAGGLGCPVLQYLAAAGVGQLTIIDHDNIDESNLHRQILFSNSDIGNSKAQTAKQKLESLNPHIKVVAKNEAFTIDNARALVEKHDLVIDGTDNFTTKFLASDICFYTDVPCVYGSISQFEGQVTFFDNTKESKNRLSLRDFYREPPPIQYQTSCSSSGVLGVLPGIVGTLMANEALKYLLGIGTTLDGEMMFYDALDGSFNNIQFGRSKTNPLQSSDISCLTSLLIPTECKNESDPMELNYSELVNSEEFATTMLIDVRTPEEHAVANLGGLNLSGSDLIDFIKSNSPSKLVLYCYSGLRSLKIATEVREMGLLDVDVYSLKGGLLESGEIVL